LAHLRFAVYIFNLDIFLPMSSTTNTAWRLAEKGKGARGLKQSQESIPAPLPHQILVRIHSVSLNFRDVAIVNGTYPVPFKNNVVLCGDMGAEVVKAGGSTTRFKVGNRVTAVVDASHIYGYEYDNGASESSTFFSYPPGLR
jgi:NADPH:quinone reductase-like Zn-dependent oxidoreductase